jgi:hypothetical protein
MHFIYTFIYKNLLSHPVSIKQEFMPEFIIPIKKLDKKPVRAGRYLKYYSNLGRITLFPGRL